MALDHAGGRVRGDIEIRRPPLTVDQKEERLAKLAQELYEEIKYVRPMYPWVLVRVLEREQKVGSLFVPMGTKQNKPVLEGIVLSVWPSHVKHINFAHKPRSLGVSTQMREHVDAEGGFIVEVMSELTPGQHVLFPHWAGVPVVGFAEDKYRLVKERDWDQTKEGGVLGVVEYGDAACTPGMTLKGMLEELYPAMDAIGFEVGVLHAAQEIEKRFVLIDRNQKSVTLSGR